MVDLTVVLHCIANVWLLQQIEDFSIVFVQWVARKTRKWVVWKRREKELLLLFNIQWKTLQNEVVWNVTTSEKNQWGKKWKWHIQQESERVMGFENAHCVQHNLLRRGGLLHSAKRDSHCCPWESFGLPLGLVSPSYNHTGWLGVEHWVTYLLPGFLVDFAFLAVVGWK